MRILWLCNIMLPVIAKSLGREVNPTGGWLSGLSEDLLKWDSIKLVVCFPINKSNDIVGQINKLSYYGVKNSKSRKEKFRKIIEKENPDIIHIFGTEFQHTLDMIEVVNDMGMISKVVISIQGLVSLCAHYYCCALPWYVIHAWTIRDLIKLDNIYFAQKKFTKAGKNEVTALKKVRHIIGRTDWDYACTYKINPNMEYHFCNETLRSPFYDARWNIEQCERHSLFVSQCNYPIKGMHLMLQVLKDIVKEFPDTHLYTTGKSPLIKDWKKNYYKKYLGRLIKKYKLEEHISFLGMLDEEEMKNQYLKTHVFVSCSSIENSPNSVGEAMLLGVPTISSDVGGVRNLLEHDIDGYIYPYNEPYMIAYYIRKIFQNDNMANYLSENSRKHANILYNRDNNVKQVIEIYKKILSYSEGIQCD